MSISTFARAEEFVEAEMNTKFGNVYISGKTHSDIAGEQIGILVTDAEQNIAHIAQVKTDADGIYEY